MWASVRLETGVALEELIDLLIQGTDMKYEYTNRPKVVRTSKSYLVPKPEEASHCISLCLCLG